MTNLLNRWAFYPNIHVFSVSLPSETESDDQTVALISQEIRRVFRVEPFGDDCGHGCALGLLQMGFQHVFRPVHHLPGYLVRVRGRDQFRCGIFLYLERQGVMSEQKVVLPTSWRLQSFLHRSVYGQDGFPASDPEDVPLECRVV